MTEIYYSFTRFARNSVMSVIYGLLLMIPINLFAQAKYNKSGDVIISGRSDQVSNGDTVTLISSLYGLDSSLEKVFRSVVRNGEYKFRIPKISQPHYIILTYKSNQLSESDLYDYMIEPADKIFISTIHGKTSFTGHGAEKYTCRYRLDSVNNIYMQTLQTTLLDILGIKKYFSVMDLSVAKRIAIVDSFKKVISKNAATLLRVDLLSGNQKFRDFILNNMTDSVRPSYSNVLADYHNDTWTVLKNLNDTVLIYSPSYANCILEKYLFDSKAYFPWNVDIKKAYDHFHTGYSGKIRERILTSFLFKYRRSVVDLKPYIAKALSVIKNPDFRQLLGNIVTNRSVGAKSFDFSLADTAGKIWHQSDFKGKVVLIDFWFTGCTNCVAIAPILKQIESKFEGRPVVFITVSTDKNRAQWIKSIKGGEYTSPYSLNLFTLGNGRNDPILKHYKIDAYPTLLLIDKEGVLGLNPKDPRLDAGQSLFESISKLL